MAFEGKTLKGTLINEDAAYPTQVALEELKGKRYVSITKMFRIHGTTELAPQKGVWIPVEVVDDLITALQEMSNVPAS